MTQSDEPACESSTTMYKGIELMMMIVKVFSTTCTCTTVTTLESVYVHVAVCRRFFVSGPNNEDRGGAHASSLRVWNVCQIIHLKVVDRAEQGMVRLYIEELCHRFIQPAISYYCHPHLSTPPPSPDTSRIILFWHI